MGSRIGNQKKAAKFIGISFEEYMSKIESGQKRCTKCKVWKIVDMFGPDKSRSDKRRPTCFTCSKVRGGLGRIPAKDIKVKARCAVNHAVRMGRLARPRTLPCIDCGNPAREYDHHLGYDLVNHLNVQPVCAKCHKIRTGIIRKQTGQFASR